MHYWLPAYFQAGDQKKGMAFKFFQVLYCQNGRHARKMKQGMSDDDITVQPWLPSNIFFGGKYDLIQLHRQMIHQNAWNLFFTRKVTSPPALLVENLNKTMKMT